MLGQRRIVLGRTGLVSGPGGVYETVERAAFGSTLIDKSIRRLRARAAGDVAGALSRGAFGDVWRMARIAVRAPDLRAEKIVSRRYGYLWLCIPKVASRSLMRALRRADPDAEVFVNERVRDVYAMRPEARNYFSFAFVRHPFGRALSFHRELHVAPTIYTGAQRLHKEEKRRELFDRFPGLAETGGFEDFCRWLNTPYGSDAFADRHFLSQHVQGHLGGDKRRPDFIGRLENIDADLRRIAAHLDMPMPALSMLNTMVGWQATPETLNAARSAMEAHLTERSEALLRARYADDLELWTKADRTVEDGVHPCVLEAAGWQ